MSRGSASVGLSYGAHSNLCVNQIRRNGTDEQKRRYLPKLISGDHVGALAMSESGSGSAARLHAFARGQARRPLCAQWQQDVDHQRPGRRNAGRLRQDRAQRRPAARHHRVPDRKRLQSFTTAQKLDKLGMRGSNTCELVFEDCEVPEENVMGREGSSVRILMSGLDYVESNFNLTKYIPFPSCLVFTHPCLV